MDTRDTLRAIFLMVLAMAGFAVADMFIKQVSVRIPIGQILIFIGSGGTLIFGALTLFNRRALITRDFLHPAVLIRNGAEIFGAFFFVSALAAIPMSSLSAIIQATPLMVTLGAIVFLKEQVGWRRWAAILAGLAGVLIIIRPGLSAFDPSSLLAVAAAAGMAARDLATRPAPKTAFSTQLATWGFAMLFITGWSVRLISGEMQTLTGGEAMRLGGAVVASSIAYFAVTVAMRIGDISAVTPFRYTRLIFGLIIGFFIFAERPDIWTLLGAGLVVGSGLYTLVRERTRAALSTGASAR